MSRSPQLRLTLVALVFALLAAFPAAAMAKRGDVKVMSRNVYLGAVTGREPVNGFWSSDHAGLFSLLNLRRR